MTVFEISVTKNFAKIQRSFKEGGNQLETQNFRKDVVVSPVNICDEDKFKKEGGENLSRV